MARIQILELPEGADDDRPPFILVVDQVPTNEAKFDALRRDLGDHEDFVERIGARAILVFEDTIDIPANTVTLEDGNTAGVVRINVEPDLDDFRQQVQAAVNDAQRRLGTALHAPKPAPEPTPPPGTTP